MDVTIETRPMQNAHNHRPFAKKLRYRTTSVLVGLIAALSFSVQAASQTPSASTAETTTSASQAVAPEASVSDIIVKPAVVENAAHQTIRESMHARLPGMAIASVSDTPIDGLYEVVTDGLIYYIDASGQFLIDGSMIDLDTRNNLTDERLGGLHMAMVDDLGEAKMLVYTPENPIDRSITVFTDISCGYCRRLHSELDTLLEAGIAVRYLMFPRAGIDSPAHKDLESVWCATNPQEAMTVAKSGGEIVAKSCENPITEHVALAEQIGLRGTPLIYMDSGVRIPGYREASVLVEMIKSSKPMSN